MVLVISRVGIAFAHAGVLVDHRKCWRFARAGAGKRAQALEPDCYRHRTVAMVLGLPIGRIVGQYFGWRTTLRHRHGRAGDAGAV